MSEARRTVAILVYDDVEVLDFAGPFEVFSVTSERNDHAPFDVWLVGEGDGPIRARNGLRVLSDHTFDTSPAVDILVVPGGAGSRREMRNRKLIGWVNEMSERAELVLSVCSGARILAAAGLLSGIPATTHHEVLDDLRDLAPDADVRADERVVDAGKIVTTGGISAGIDGSFHVVDRLLGTATALRTARYMEYDWRPAVSSRTTV